MNKYFELIEESQKRAKLGGFNSIPWALNRLTNDLFFPGWVPGKYYCITGNSSTGKTKVLKYLAIYNTYLHWVSTGKSYDFKIMWFALEESEEDFWLSMICLSIYVQTGGAIQLTPTILLKQGKRELTRIELDYIKKAEQSEFLKTLYEKLSVFDYIFNPTGIKKEIDKYVTQPHIGELIKNPAGIVTGYTAKSNDHFLLIVTDHISLLHAEKSFLGENMTDHQTLKFFSGTYCLNSFCKRYKAIVINSHQQDQAKENMEYTNRGGLIEQKLEPSLDHLANNKEIQRDYDCVLGIFNPHRYDIEKHAGYDLRVANLDFGRQYRSLKFLKDRLAGLEGSRLGTYFNGAVPYLEELPKIQTGMPLILPGYPNDSLFKIYLADYKKYEATIKK